MDDISTQLEALARTEARIAMATLVATKGTTPKREGAKMWVGEGGRVLGSVTIGGCVDAKVIAEAARALSGSAPQLLSMALGDEDAWEMGFACGGTVEVLVEPLSLSPPAALVGLYRRIAQELAAGRGACLVRPLGGGTSSLLVLQDSTSEGTLGGEAQDGLARRQALELLGRGLSRSQPLGEGGPEAFFEVHAPLPELLLVGAGHVSQALAALAKPLGFRITVIDPRPRFATRERFPEADAILVGIVSELVERLPLSARTAVVITIHDYKIEVPVLRALLSREPGYIGMLGNRRRGKAVLEVLREEGVAEERLAKVQVPVGLEIGAESTAEIALSVLAQIVAVRAGKGSGSVAAKPQAAGGAR